MGRIPIKALKELSKKYSLDHVIVFATEKETQHIATYGRTIDECSEAADFGNKMKDALGWPESLHQQPSRVRKLQKRILAETGVYEWLSKTGTRQQQCKQCNLDRSRKRHCKQSNNKER